MVDPQTLLGSMVDGEAQSFNEQEGEVSDPAYVCRSIGFFLDFLVSVGPALALVAVAWRVSK
jgi:hypothetical protein